MKPQFYEDLTSYKTNGLYSIEGINLWLKEHKTEYEDIKYRRPRCIICGREEELPCLHHRDPFEVILYDNLMAFSIAQEKELLYKGIVDEFELIKKDKNKIDDWLRKHEEIVTNEILMLIIDYLNYSDSKTDDYPFNIYIQELNGFNIYVSRDAFKNALMIWGIYGKYFWWDKEDE